ncbi:MAG: conserved membrane protein of unknown function [Nitrospira sp.]|nr:MAG: conserved membrane protein of unknown function [Nitrospira sp.]
MMVSLKVVFRDAAIVYGLTFAAGLVMAFLGVNLQSNPSTAYMANLLSGALGFTVSGIRISHSRTEHLAWVAATVWIFNLANIALRIQTSTSWIRSGLTLILMAALGGTLAMILTLTSSSHRRMETGCKEEPTHQSGPQ